MFNKPLSVKFNEFYYLVETKCKITDNRDPLLLETNIIINPDKKENLKRTHLRRLAVKQNFKYSSLYINKELWRFILKHNKNLFLSGYDYTDYPNRNKYVGLTKIYKRLGFNIVSPLTLNSLMLAKQRNPTEQQKSLARLKALAYCNFIYLVEPTGTFNDPQLFLEYMFAIKNNIYLINAPYTNKNKIEINVNKNFSLQKEIYDYTYKQFFNRPDVILVVNKDSTYKTALKNAIVCWIYERGRDPLATSMITGVAENKISAMLYRFKIRPDYNYYFNFAEQFGIMFYSNLMEMNYETNRN